MKTKSFLEWYFSCQDNHLYFIKTLPLPNKSLIKEAVNITENKENSIANSAANNLVSLETNSLQCIITVYSKINYLSIIAYLLSDNINYQITVRNNICSTFYYDININGSIYVNQMYENTYVNYSGNLSPLLTVSYTN